MPEHKWKLEYPIGDIENEEIYNWILKNRFAIISTEYPIEFTIDSVLIDKDNIEINDSYIIIDLSSYSYSFNQLYYKNIPLYKNESKKDLSLLEYFIDEEKIYLLNQDIDIDSFKIVYSKRNKTTTKFYVKFEYPAYFVDNSDLSINYDKRITKNQHFLKWNYGKFIDDTFNVFSDDLYKIPSKDFFCFWKESDNNRQFIASDIPEFLVYYITYDNKSIGFIIENEMSSNISGFSYIGALENCKDSLTNELDNFGSCGNALLWPNKLCQLDSENYIDNTRQKSEIESVNFVLYRTPAGSFYQEYKISAYSVWEMDVNRYKKLSFTSSFTEMTTLSKIQLVHPYEMERGYLRRILTTPSTGEHKILIEVNYNNNDEDFIYLKRNRTKDMFKNSNILFNTILFQVTN